jgi:hypothetical protein
MSAIVIIALAIQGIALAFMLGTSVKLVVNHEPFEQ